MSQYQLKKQKKSRLGSVFSRMNLSFIHRLLVAGVFVLGAAYLFQTNSVAVQGYKIKTLENEVFALKDQNQKLSVESAQLHSSAHIEQEVAKLPLVPVESVEYLSTLGTVVASR